MTAEIEYLAYTTGGWHLRFRTRTDAEFRATLAGIKSLPVWARFWDRLAQGGRGAWWINYSSLEQIGYLFSNYQTMRDQVEAPYRHEYQREEQARQKCKAHAGRQQKRQKRPRQPRQQQPPPSELLRLPETWQEALVVLRLPLTASVQDIKGAYRRKALQVHPDHGGSHAAMVILNRAYEIALEHVSVHKMD
jgi:hypothetical protein